jgi:predicted AlkP superfamily phosphohydrolase/phosphomutase
MPYDTNGVSDGVLSDEAFLGQCETILGENERMLAHELARFKGGLLVAYFEAPDAAQHMYWRAIDPEHPAYTKELAARYGRVIPECYARMDGILGQTMAAMGKRGAVVVLSDHGFAPFRRAVHLNSILRDMGYLALKEGTTSPELLKNVDWSRTRAYAVGFNSVYLNLAGREGEGIVRAEEAAPLSVEIAGRLESLEDGPAGAHPIKRAYVTSDIYGKAGGANMPDLIVGYARGYRASWQTSLGGAPDGLAEDNRKAWSGDHLMDAGDLPGVFLSSDRALDAPSIADVGPALISYFNHEATTRTVHRTE